MDISPRTGWIISAVPLLLYDATYHSLNSLPGVLQVLTNYDLEKQESFFFQSVLKTRTT